ncbi:MAG: NAAT family transporter [Ottowia sp.]|nr:NAAT family transporter [Ottowia sp.]
MDVFKELLLLVALVNPLGAIPFFIGMTQHQSLAERRRIASTVALTVGLVIAISTLVGGQVIHAFNISIASLQVGGGIVVLLMAISMVNAQPGGTRNTPEETVEAGTRSVVAVVPLAIPILTGPATISTVIVYAEQADSWLQRFNLIGCGVLIGLIVWAALRLAEPVSYWLGRTGINIATRIFGLLLTAMSVEFIVAGLLALLPGLRT